MDDEIHLVIVATPNQLHFPLAHEALSRGAHVLIEKPFVIWPEDGRKLVEAAAANNRVIAINQTRRFFPLAHELRRKINEGQFGSLKSIVHREGTKLTWPFESGAAFAQGAQRTGVIMDFGVHVIDFYHYLLQPRWTFISAVHDGFYGPEGLAEIELQANDAPVSIRLSRYHPQENVAHLVFERAEISFNVYDPTTLLHSIEFRHDHVLFHGTCRHGIRKLCRAVALKLSGRQPRSASRRYVMPRRLCRSSNFSMRYIISLGNILRNSVPCKGRLTCGWLFLAPAVSSVGGSAKSYPSKTISKLSLVYASGRRLCGLRGAVLISGGLDLEDANELPSILTGADVVVNAAMPPPSREPELVTALYFACVRAGVRRFIQFSSAAIYGNRTGKVDENMAPAPVDDYSRGKAEMESRLR